VYLGGTPCLFTDIHSLILVNLLLGNHCLATLLHADVPC